MIPNDQGWVRTPSAALSTPTDSSNSNAELTQRPQSYEHWRLSHGKQRPISSRLRVLALPCGSCEWDRELCIRRHYVGKIRL